MPSPEGRIEILITGAAGNLGRKLIAMLARENWCAGITGLDRALPDPLPATAGAPVRWHAADLTQRGGWSRHFAGIDAAIHLAAVNPYPDASWAEALASFDMTLAVGEAALGAGVSRFVFASSNHVMGGYLDDSRTVAGEAGWLTPDLPPEPGTKWRGDGRDMDSTKYAASKAFGERIVADLGRRSGGALMPVVLRIGWAQPGANSPETLSAAGSPLPGTAAASGGDTVAERWFRGMWLSNRDFEQLVRLALTARADGWPQTGIVVNAMSANAGMAWSLARTRDLLGYTPEDDSSRS